VYDLSNGSVSNDLDFKVTGLLLMPSTYCDARSVCDSEVLVLPVSDSVSHSLQKVNVYQQTKFRSCSSIHIIDFRLVSCVCHD